MALDLRGRSVFADSVERNVLPFLRTLPTFGGAYYDQANSGTLTVLLTVRDPGLEAVISQKMVGSTGPWRVEEATHTERSLTAALDRAQSTWSVVGGGPALGFGLDTRSNAIFVEVEANDSALAASAAGRLVDALGVRVVVRVGTPGYDTACTDRDHCSSPMKAGVNIYKGAVHGLPADCTLGWFIVRSGDKQFVTAGHCSFNNPGLTWIHPGFGSLGVRLQTLYANNGQDIMRVGLGTDSQASDDVYNDGNDTVGSSTPTQGETLCASLGGGSNAVKCGTVQSALRTWTSETCNCTVSGGDMSYTTIPGDSGSPVYRRLPGGTGDQLRAIGVNDHQNGYFARLDTSLDDFAATVMQ